MVYLLDNFWASLDAPLANLMRPRLHGSVPDYPVHRLPKIVSWTVTSGKFNAALFEVGSDAASTSASAIIPAAPENTNYSITNYAGSTDM